MRIEREERAGLAPARVEEAVRDFERHGYVVFEGCLDEAFVAELREAYDVVLDLRPKEQARCPHRRPPRRPRRLIA